MNKEFINHALSHGKSGQQWLEQIPEIIKEYEQKWSIKVLPPYNLTYNYVAPTIGKEGMNTVLKIGFPEDKEFKNEVEALKFFNGNGVTKLIKADKKNAVILIEQINPGTPLSKLEDDEKATRIIARLMKKLWKPLPKNHPFITVSEWTIALRQYPHRSHRPVPMDLVEIAKKLFQELIASSQRPILTHADLHHDNVLSSNRDEWLAIDPKGIAAEPAYETTAMIRNPYKKISKMRNIEELLKKRILILAEELNFNPGRIHKWCLAQTILSGVWTSEEENDTVHALKVIRALQRISFH